MIKIYVWWLLLGRWPTKQQSWFRGIGELEYQYKNCLLCFRDIRRLVFEVHPLSLEYEAWKKASLWYCCLPGECRTFSISWAGKCCTFSVTTAIIRHLRPLDGRQMRLDTTCGHLRSLAATCGHLRSLALGGHLRALAVTCGHLRSLALGGHLRSLAVTRVAASDCKWLIFPKSNTALPTCSMKRYKKTSSKFNGKSQDLQALEKGLEAFQKHSRIDTHIGPQEPKGKESRNTRRLLQIFCVNTNFWLQTC